MKSIVRRTLPVAIILALGLPALAQTVPPGFTVESYGGPLYGGTAMAWAPDGRLFVAKQFGQVVVIKNGTLLPTPFHTPTVDYPVGGERGLLGMCIDPSFATNGYLYLYYTAPTPNPHNVVRRIQASPGSDVSTGVETPIIDLEDLGPSSEHNGSAMAFGPDGKLYIGMGENVDPAKAQSLTSRFGKILRYNPDGTIPADNPTSFAGIAGTTSGEFRAIWAVGLRNPWRMAFLPGTLRLFINDVGDYSWEEINEGAPGLNFGWGPGSGDGPHNTANLTDPFFAYSHTTGTPQGTCVTGGAFYNPSAVLYPGSYVGKYFFTDFGAGFIRYLDPGIPGASFPFLEGASGPVELAVGPDGALYYLNLTGTQGVFRVAYSSAGVQGVVISTDTLTVNEGSTATFGVRLSAQPAGPVNVGVTNTIGSASVSASPGTLTFTSANWNVDQTVTVSAGVDADVYDNGATIRVASSNDSKTVIVTAVDTSPPPAAGQPFTRITSPRNGDIVTGSRAEFFGTSVPAGGSATTQAEFFIDGALQYTDVGPGHYHFNGGHSAWDTTRLSDGVHVLRMTVTDNASPPRTGSHEITVTVNNAGGGQPKSSTGTSQAKSKNCGATGLEAAAVLALAALLRRRSAR